MEDLTIDDARDGFADNRFTCRDLVEYYIERIRAYNGPLPSERNPDSQSSQSDTSPSLPGGSHSNPGSFGLNAIVTISKTALEEADELDDYYAQRNVFIGPLHGIPVIVKDSIATAGLRTTYGSSKARDHVPKVNATVIDKLKAAGAIILAKSTLPGITKNPYNPSHDPCSGTGAAIAADFAILGLDTDTDGNIGLPASFCSLVGLRPRPGMISRYGISPLVVPQDTPGPVCRTVRDAALMYGAMDGFDPQDNLTAYAEVIAPDPEDTDEPFAAGLRFAEASTLKIGVVDSLFGSDDEEECRPVNELVRNALDRLREAGATIVPITISKLPQWFVTTHMYADRSRADLDRFFKNFLPSLDLSVKAIQEEGVYHPSQDLFELIAKGAGGIHDPAYALRLEKREEFRPFVMSQMRQSEVDLLAFPTCQIAAPSTKDVLAKRWSAANFPTNTYLAAQTSLPGISVPVGVAPGGLPVGMMLVASSYHEKQLLEAAAVVEREVRGRASPMLDSPQ